MHPEQNELSEISDQDVLDDLVMEKDCPDLGDSFYMCLPATIVGYNMQRKAWGTFKAIFLVLISRCAN